MAANPKSRKALFARRSDATRGALSAPALSEKLPIPPKPVTKPKPVNPAKRGGALMGM